MNTSFEYKCGESRLVILWVSGPACRGDNTRRRKKLQSAPDFCPSPVVIMRNHSYFLIWVGCHADSLPVLGSAPDLWLPPSTGTNIDLRLLEYHTAARFPQPPLLPQGHHPHPRGAKPIT